MAKLGKILGWVLAVLGVICFLLALLVIVEGSDDKQGATFGFLMLGIMFGLPGGALIWHLRRREQKRDLESQLVGYMKSYDTFTVQELAQKIGRAEVETEKLIMKLIAQEQLKLGFHRKTRQYMHQNRLKTAYQCVKQCPSCGAAVGTEIIFAGEEVFCPYCDHLLSGS